jgi:hypothetical protein
VAVVIYSEVRMGGHTHDRAIHEPNRRTGGNGTARRNNAGFENGPSWSEVTPEELGNFISRVTDGGACCIFSKSADGGVLSLTVIYGGERWRGYPRSEPDVLALFREITEYLMV